MARPSVYTPELVDKIVRTLSSGTPIKFACEANGVSYDTVNDWMNGKKGIPKSEVVRFVQRIREAEAQAVVARVARIAIAGQNGDWKADSWYLEHVHSETFAGRSKNDTKLSDADGGPLTVVIERITRREDAA